MPAEVHQDRWVVHRGDHDRSPLLPRFGSGSFPSRFSSPLFMHAADFVCPVVFSLLQFLYYFEQGVETVSFSFLLFLPSSRFRPLDVKLRVFPSIPSSITDSLHPFRASGHRSIRQLARGSHHL